MHKLIVMAVVLVLLGTVGAAGCNTPTTETSTQVPLNSSSTNATTNATTTVNTATQSIGTASPPPPSTPTPTASPSVTPTATPETTATPTPVTRTQPILTWDPTGGANIFLDLNPTINTTVIGQSSYSMSVNVEPSSACLWLRWYLDGYELPSQSNCTQGTVTSTTTFYVSGMSEGYHTIVVVFKGDNQYEWVSLGGTFLVVS
jgi:hypothetical protein